MSKKAELQGGLGGGGAGVLAGLNYEKKHRYYKERFDLLCEMCL